MKKENLIRESSYAKFMNVTTMCVAKWRYAGKIKNVVIDGMNFVELSDEELAKYNEWRNK